MGLLLTFLFTALYGSGNEEDSQARHQKTLTMDSENPFQENLLKIEVVPIRTAERQKMSDQTEQKPREPVTSPRHATSPSIYSKVSKISRLSRARKRSMDAGWSVLGNALGKFYKYCTQTPFLALQVVRMCLLIWLVKYSTYSSLLLLGWLYYSVVYSDKNKFYYWTRISIIPITGIQYLLCKLANIPDAVSGRWKDLPVIQELGIFFFGQDPKISPEAEYFWMGTVFFACCLTGRLTRTVPEYDSWIVSTIGVTCGTIIFRRSRNGKTNLPEAGRLPSICSSVTPTSYSWSWCL